MTNSTAGAVSDERSAFEDYFAPIVTHGMIVVGILYLNWDVVEILLLYLLEVVVIHVLFVTVALFAAQPIADHDADKWETDPVPITLVSALPPVYNRNIGLVAKYMIFGLIYTLPFLYAVVQFADRSLPSLFSPTISLAALAICVSQLARVWRQFIGNQSYLERSPAEAIRVGLWPMHELIVTVLFVVVPVTFVLVAASFVVGEIASQTLVLLAYVVPIGAARVWLQHGNLTVKLQYEK
ncbi:MAG: DUF6498-containing protein [Halorubrum sp.]